MFSIPEFKSLLAKMQHGADCMTNITQSSKQAVHRLGCEHSATESP